MRLETVVAAAAALLSVAPGPTFAQFPPGGPEIPLNVVTAGEQVLPAAAVEADGGTVVVWRSGTSAIAARRLDRAGALRGGEIAVNVLPAAADARPRVAAFPGGGFAVVWHAPDASGHGVFVRRFDAAGLPVGGELAVNTTTAGDQRDPYIAGGPFGYAVAFASGPFTAPNVVGRLLNAGGTPVGVEIPVGAGATPAVAWRGNGIVFAWAVGDMAGTVHVRLFSGAGAPLGSPTQANGANPWLPCFPICGGSYTRSGIGVASRADGSFVVSWDLRGFGATGGLAPTALYFMQYGSYVRRYGAGGGAIGPEAAVNVHFLGSQDNPSVAISPDGRIFAAWTSSPTAEGCIGPTGCFPDPPPPPQDGSGAGVFARLLDAAGNDIGGGEARANATTASGQLNPGVAMTDAAALVAYQSPDAAGNGIFARRFPFSLLPAGLQVDETGNRVLESGEAAVVAPAWRNVTGIAQTLTGSASAFTGPGGAAYSIADGTADYGTIADGAAKSCRDTGDCFVLAVSGPRPAAHWDASFVESGTPPLFAPRTRTLHVGDSFADVPRGGGFYRFVETAFHTGAMLPCGPTAFCPTIPVTREWMAYFVLKALSPTYAPPPCGFSPRFTDVPTASPFCPWIEELARRGVVAGCTPSQYCPTATVSRETMAVYLLLTREGTGYVPPACATPVFGDVPATSPFCRWIEELARRQIVTGCGGGAYCPTAAVSREQMSVFLAGTFGLLLYAP
jgi:hypothetical protein